MSLLTTGYTLGDTINASFETIGGILIWLNVRRLWHDKLIRGIDWQVTGFFWAWGLWNMIYYPSLHQWASFFGGLLMISGNTVWIALAIKYRKN